jgi:hypothetical protein
MDMTTLITNFFIISIPEETFLVVFSLILMKKFKLLTWDIKNILKISFVVLGTASINLLLKFLNFDYTILTILFFMITTAILSKPKTLKQFGIAILCTGVSFGIFNLLELLYLPLLCSIFNIEIDKLNNSSLWSFLLTIPERIVEATLIILPLRNKFANKFYLAKELFEDLRLFIVFSSWLGFSLFSMIYFYYLFDKYQILNNLPYYSKCIFVFYSLVVPISSYKLICMMLKIKGLLLMSREKMRINELKFNALMKKATLMKRVS